MGWARYARTASLIMLVFASNQLIPFEKQCLSKRRKARNANPIWFRWAIALRAKHLSTPTNCLMPRWYTSIDQDNSAYFRRYKSFIDRLLVAQYSMSPCGETILKTLISHSSDERWFLSRLWVAHRPADCPAYLNWPVDSTSIGSANAKDNAESP